MMLLLVFDVIDYYIRLSNRICERSISILPALKVEKFRFLSSIGL
jgi:hypothetical protein